MERSLEKPKLHCVGRSSMTFCMSLDWTFSATEQDCIIVSLTIAVRLVSHELELDMEKGTCLTDRKTQFCRDVDATDVKRMSLRSRRVDKIFVNAGWLMLCPGSTDWVSLSRLRCHSQTSSPKTWPGLSPTEPPLTNRDIKVRSSAVKLRAGWVS